MAQLMISPSCCGPGAVAAIADVGRYVAALKLTWCIEDQGRELPEDGAVTVGDIAIVLAGYGIDLEPWSVHPGGGPLVTVPQFRMAVLEALVELPPVDWSDSDPSETERGPTVREFVAAHPRDTWMITIRRHVMVARDGAVIAGDVLGEYADEPLWAAFRVIYPSTRKDRSDA